jgi:hypothetical protein
VKTGIAERILRELLRSPKFKTELKMLFSSIDPSSGRELIRTLFWEDVETFMGLVSSLPAILNLLVQMLREMAVQLDTFPPEMLNSFIYQVLGTIDGRAMGEMAGKLGGILGKVMATEAAKATTANIAADVKAGLGSVQSDGEGFLAIIAQSLGEALGKNPQFVSQVLGPVIAGAQAAAPQVLS